MPSFRPNRLTTSWKYFRDFIFGAKSQQIFLDADGITHLLRCHHLLPWPPLGARSLTN